jgi:tetratricopeptide (TPR) repeat protein
VNLARTHKLAGNYGSAWKLYEELLVDPIVEECEYEELYKDIALDMVRGDRTPMSDKCRNCFDYVEYTRLNGNLDVHAYTLSEVYVQLGLVYWHDCDDAQQALLCFDRDIELRRTDKGVGDDSVSFANTYVLQANIHARPEGNHQMALKLYSQAIGHFSHQENERNVQIATCWSQIGRLRPIHETETFERAFDLLLTGDNEMYAVDAEEIALCYLCLAKSCARSEFHSLALESAQHSLRLYLNDGSQVMEDIRKDFDSCCDLLITLHQSKNGKHEIYG